ncbi:MAG: M50 family metallopeptidase [Clostridia bacterium]
MFKNSVTVAHVLGIPIRLHVSFLLILPFMAFVIGNNIGAIADMAAVPSEEIAVHPYALGLILASLLFVSVALHELSHSLVAIRQGMRINGITLMLLGGVAEIDDEAAERDEMWMALAGPLFSLALGLVLLFLVRPALRSMSGDLRVVIYYLGYMNIFLAAFNLIPAFPSDGGRVLRSLIARRTSYLRATQLATSIGKGFALLFALFGFLIGNLILVLVAFFIYMGASSEYQVNLLRDVFSDLAVSDLMTRDVASVNPSDSVTELMNRMVEERHSGYPVVDETGDLIGCVTLGDIRERSSGDPDEEFVEDIMSRDLITVSPEEDLYSAFSKLSEAEIGRLMVVKGGALVGILTRSDIMKAYQVKELREERRRMHA